MVSELDAALSRLAQVTARQIGRDFANLAGAGAAGGLAFGLVAFGGARLRSGFELVCHELGLEQRVQRADLVLTGEGRLDRQSSYGKGPGSLATLAKRHGKRTVIFAGRVDPTFSPAESPFDEVLEVSTRKFGSRSHLFASRVAVRRSAGGKYAQIRLGSGRVDSCPAPPSRCRALGARGGFAFLIASGHLEFTES
jgi:glycerate kinase